MNLLIIDDHPEDYDSFAIDIQRANLGVNIAYASSSPSAIGRFDEIKPDLIILDQVMGGGENDGTAFLHWLSESAIGGSYPQIIFVTAHYKQIPAWQILDTAVPISLFIQKGPSFPEMLLIGVQLIIRRAMGTPRYTPQGLFGEKFLRLILEECHLIEQQEHAGYLTINQQRQISTLIRSYVSSLETRSFWNDDDIMDISIFFAEGLCRVFDLPDQPVEVLRRFLNIEEILYTVPHYRDHFFHQIKVFLLGYCIVNALNRGNRLSGTLLSEKNGMKIWFMTSAFHDIGYPFEKMTIWLERFIEGVLRSPRDNSKEPVVQIAFPWGELLSRRFHAYHLKRIVERACELYQRNSSDVVSELLACIMSSTIKAADHGIFSSLIVQNFLGGKVDDDEILPVALSIALHNADVAELVRRVIGMQTFQRDPLSFLLAFCDLSQDWGRTKPLGLGTSGYQRFGFPVFDGESVVDLNRNTVHVPLLYERSMEVNEVSTWRTDVFYKHIRPMRDWWSVGSPGHNCPNFCIEYRHKDGLLEELTF